MTSKTLRILIACEESQAVTIEFRELGHEAYSCDLEPCSGGHPEWHLQQDVTELLEQEWDLIIAFPPCTYMSNAGACRMYPTKGNICNERLKKGTEAKEFFMLFYNCKCNKVVIENPKPLKVIGLPEPSQIVQPYMFGEPFSKKTLLWIKGLPNLEPTNILTEWQPFINGGGSKRIKTEFKGKKFANSAKSRSKTFRGIAKAMAEQWSNYLTTNNI